MQVQIRDLHLSRAKMKATSQTSALLAGFAIISMVEMQIDNDENSPPSEVLIMFSVVTTLLVVVHVFALMISTCILPNMDMAATLRHKDAYKHSPHPALKCFVEMAWILSTFVGLALFFFELALLVYLKFFPLKKKIQKSSSDHSQNLQTNDTQTLNPLLPLSSSSNDAPFYHNPPVACSLAILGPSLLLFIVFAIIFYKKVAEHRLKLMKEEYQRDMEEPFEFANTPIYHQRFSQSSSRQARLHTMSEEFIPLSP